VALVRDGRGEQLPELERPLMRLFLRMLAIDEELAGSP
jgi:hypothetical protein